MKLVLIRHGQSVWNKENRFSGWTDVSLSENGVEEAKEAGRILLRDKFTFDIAFDSVLKRSNQTREIVLKEMNLDIPVIRSWRLNERHYGALQGLNKAETAKKLGKEKVHVWRRSYDVRPPALEKTDEQYPGNDPRYKDLSENELPVTESLKDTVDRVLQFWHENIVPEIKKGKKVIIFAHGNSLRALVKYLDDIPDEEIPKLNIPTGIPLVYELDDDLRPIRHYYLGDPEEIKKATEEVLKQID